MSTIVTSVSSARPPSTPLGPGAGSARGAVAVTALAVAVLVAALAVAGGPTTTVSGERTRTADPNAAVAVVPAETIVRADGGRATPTSVLATGQALGGPGTDPLAFVRANAGWYGLTDSDLAGLATVRDTASPGGSLRTVTIEQRDGTRRVLGAALKLTLDADGRVLLAAGTLAPAAHATSPATVEALTAVAVAAREVGRSLPTDLVSRPTAHGRVFEPPRSGPDQAITAEAVTLPATGGTTATPGWVVTLHADGVPNEVVVDATTGDVVAATQQAFHTGPQATVFLGQDPTVGAPTTVPLVGAPHNLAGWVTDDTTIGNNADAREDANGDDVADYRPTTPPSGDAAYQHFDFPFTDAFVTSGGTDTTTDRDFTITQAFYRVNWLHDYYYALGFDEAAGNFQTDNFGRGGVGGDPMLVDVHDNSGGRSFTQSPPDGGPGRITLMAPVGAVDHALDMDLVTHEYTHAVTNRLVNNGPLPKGVQTWALGESWSDFFSTSMWDDPIAGEYVCQNATNGCLLGPYDTSTLVYSDLCTLASGTCEVHRDGEIFTAALWDLRQLLTTRLGAAAGRAATEQLVFDGVRATSPALATFLDARDAIVAADLATTGGANTCLVWAAFAEHEMGLSASTSADQETVTPATDVPAGCVPTADAGGPYAVGEGDTLVLDATGSSPGTDPSVGATSYRWDLDEDGDFDDASGATPTFPATGDDIVATVAVQVSNEGGVTAVATAAVVVSNVEPIVAIDPTGLVDEAGDPVVVQGPGGSATLTASATDPGSDDLVFTWDPGDGTAPQSHMSLVNPPVADPPASPTHQPRAVTDTLSHTWLPGCTHTAGVLVTDDDGGTSTTASGTVVAVGTATTLRGTGWWKAAWRLAHPHGLDPSERDCLVAMVTVLSTVWTGPAGTNPLDPVAVLKTAGSGGDAARLFDRALLTAWLNLAAGALDPAALVDLDGDGVGDTAVFDLLATAEQARLDPTTSRGALLALKDRLEALSTT